MTRIRKTVLNNVLLPMFKHHSPTPIKWGAGDLIEKVQYGTVFGNSVYSVPAGRYSSKCFYQKHDHGVIWTVKKGYRYSVIGGIITAFTPADYKKYMAHEVVPCHWPEKSVGFASKWISGYIYRGVHAKSSRGLKVKVDKHRRQSVINKMLSRKFNKNKIEIAKRTWITKEALRSVGACTPGINQATQEIMEQLHAGTIGAVRADYLISMGGKFALYADKVLNYQFAKAL
jgi:hypothetical protein